MPGCSGRIAIGPELRSGPKLAAEGGTCVRRLFAIPPKIDSSRRWFSDAGILSVSSECGEPEGSSNGSFEGLLRKFIFGGLWLLLATFSLAVWQLLTFFGL